MKIIIDAMGGDFAPEAPVRGALLAREKYGADIILTGRTADILRELEKAGCKEVPQGIEIANAEEVVEICDDPATAFKQKKDSSLTVGLNLLRDGQADGFISAGSTGALLAGATLVVKRIRGLRRAALAPTIPTMTGKAVLIDCGANAECTSEYLLQFAYLGSYYAEKVLGVVQPRVGLLNIGAEPSKGDALRHETYARLKETGEQGHLNFIGNIEANTALAGGCDVIVADGYSGNIMLKSVEGAAKLMSGELKKMLTKSAKTKLAYLLLKDGLADFKKMLDPNEVGGTALLGTLQLAREPSLTLFCVEQNAAANALAEKGFAENGWTERVTLRTGDLRENAALPAAGSMDYVVSNPPYFPAGSGASAAGEARQAAREEAGCTLADVCAAAARVLRWGGRFALVHRPERLSDLFCTLRAHGLEPKRLRFVASSAENAPSLALVEARRGGKTGLSVEPMLFIGSADWDEVYFRT